MPARRDALVAAVAAYNRSHKPLPHSTVRLLEAMFTRDDVCQQSLEALEDFPAFPASPSRRSCAPSSRQASSRRRTRGPAGTPTATASC